MIEITKVYYKTSKKYSLSEFLLFHRFHIHHKCKV